MITSARTLRTLLLMLTLAVVALSGCSYNQFTTQEEAIKGSFGEVQNQLQRRNELIPNLVETVKGFAAQEKEILQIDRRFARQAGRRADAGGHHRSGQRTVAGAVAAAGHRRKLSAVEVERELRAADG